DADVGGVDVRVDVVVGELAVLALAHHVGQLAEGEQVGVLFEVQAVLEGQALARLDFLPDGAQTGVAWLRHKGLQRPGVAVLFTGLKFQKGLKLSLSILSPRGPGVNANPGEPATRPWRNATPRHLLSSPAAGAGQVPPHRAGPSRQTPHQRRL